MKEYASPQEREKESARYDAMLRSVREYLDTQFNYPSKPWDDAYQRIVLAVHGAISQ